MNVALILTTVNAPYSEQLDAHEIAHCLLDQTAAKAAAGHMSSFFGEVKPELQVGFANMFNISPPSFLPRQKRSLVILASHTRSRRDQSQAAFGLGAAVSNGVLPDTSGKLTANNY